MQLGKLLVEANRKKEAVDVLERLNDIYPEADGLHRQLGNLLFDQGDARGSHPGIQECGGAPTPSTRHRLTSTWRAPTI